VKTTSEEPLNRSIENREIDCLLIGSTPLRSGTINYCDMQQIKYDTGRAIRQPDSNMLNRDEQYSSNSHTPISPDGGKGSGGSGGSINPGQRVSGSQCYTIWSGPEKASPHTVIQHQQILRVPQNQKLSTSKHDNPIGRESNLNRIITPIHTDCYHFEDERHKRWGWQLPLFPGFFPPLPPVDDPPVPEYLDDTLPHGDIPGQLLLDLDL